MNGSCSIAIFASGNGSNAEAIISFLQENAQIRVDAIYSNNKNAYVLQRAANHKIPAFLFDRKTFYSKEYQQLLVAKQYDLIVLAGFMWLIPEILVKGYPNRIINIHPALLPKFGGKGMYGHFVHEAVLVNKEKESGITIHYVNEHYDEGSIIFQKSCPVLTNDTADTLADRIHSLEHRYYPEIVKKMCLKIISEA